MTWQYNKIRMFMYKRGDKFSVRVIVNEFAASVTFVDIVVPDNTPNAVKDAFLDEAENAVTLKLDNDGRQYGY